MLRGVGAPLLEKFLGVWFLGFLVSKILSFSVSILKDSMVPYHRTSISCFFDRY